MGNPPGNVAELYLNSNAAAPIATDDSSPYELAVQATVTTSYCIRAKDSNNGCTSNQCVPVTATVNFIPGLPTVANVSRCGAGNVTFTIANAGFPPANRFLLYTQPAGGTPVASVTLPLTQITTNVTTTTIFYIESLNTSTGCQSASRLAVSAIVQPEPILTLTSSNVEICGPGDVTLNPSFGPAGGDEAQLYDANCSLLITNDKTAPYQLKTPYVTTTTTFALKAKNNSTGCESSTCLPVTIIVKPLPMPPTVNDVARCGIGNLTFTITNVPPGGTVFVYNQLVGGSPVATISGPNYEFQLSNLANTTTYYFENYDPQTQCMSGSRTQAKAIINPFPSRATLSSNSISRCGSGEVTIPVNLQNPTNTQVFLTTAIGAPPVQVDANSPYEFKVDVQNDVTYYLCTENVVTGCKREDDCIAVTISISQLPASPVPQSQSVQRCGPGLVTFTVNLGGSVGDVIRLYDAPVGGTLRAVSSNGPDFILTPNGGVLQTTTTFWLEAGSSATGCVSSSRTQVVAVIQPVPNPPSVTSSNLSVCSGGGGVISVQTNDPNTQEIRLYNTASASVPLQTITLPNNQFNINNISQNTTYYLESFSTVTSCRSTTRTSISISVIPPPEPATPPSIISSCGPGEARITIANVPPGNEVLMYNEISGGVLLESSIVAPYSFTVPIVTGQEKYCFEVRNLATSCLNATRRCTEAVLHQPPAPPAVPPTLKLCGGGIQRFTVTMPANNLVLEVYNSLTGGAPIAIDATEPYTFDTPEIRTTTTFYLQAYHPVHNCRSPRVPAVVTVYPIPSAPPALTDIRRCGSGDVKFTASMGLQITGDSLRLYDAAQGGNMIARAKGPVAEFTIPNVSTHSVFFLENYNSATGCVSERTPIYVKINRIPSPPYTANAARCGTGIVNFSATLTGGMGDAVRLFTQPSGDSPIYVDYTAPFEVLTPVITQETSYFLDVVNLETQCSSSRVGVTAFINPIPSPPVAIDFKRCGSGPASITAVLGNGGDEIQIFENEVGGAPIQVDNQSPYVLFIPNVEQTRYYYVQSVERATGCASGRVPVKVEILDIPEAPMISSVSRCGAGVVTLTISNLVQNGVVSVLNDNFEPIIFGNPAPNQISIQVTSTSRFYVEVINNSTILHCKSSRSPVEVIVNPIPPSPTAANVRRCGVGSVRVLINAQNAARVDIFDALYNLVATQSSAPFEYLTPQLQQTSVFWLQSTSNYGCKSELVFFNVEIVPKPLPPIVENLSRCGPGSITLSVQGIVPGNVLRVYTIHDLQTPFSVLTSWPYIVETPTLTSNTDLFFIVQDPITGCSSERTIVGLKIHPIPLAPFVENLQRCGEGPVTFTVSPADNHTSAIHVYDPEISMLTPVEVLAQSPYQFTRIISSNKTFYFAAVDKVTSCNSNLVLAHATILEPPANPVVNVAQVHRCGPGQVVLTVQSSPGAEVRLYASQTENMILDQDNTHTQGYYHLVTPFLNASTTFYIESFFTSNNCPSRVGRVAVPVIIYPLPEPPVASNLERCGPGIVTFSLNPTGTSAQTLIMYDTPIGGIPIQSVSIPPYTIRHTVLQNSEFYFGAVNNETGCHSASRTKVNIKLNPVPLPPSVENVSRCGDGIVTFTVSTAEADKILVYANIDGGQPIGSSTVAPYSFAVPISSSITSFYFEAVNSTTGCASPRAEALAIRQEVPYPPQNVIITRCGPGVITVTAVQNFPPFGDQMLLYESSGNIVMASVNRPPFIFSINITTTTTFYLAASVAATGCQSEKAPVVIRVASKPGIVKTSSVERCGPGTVTFTAWMGFPVGTSVRLYNAPEEGNLIAVDSVGPQPYLLSVNVTTTTTFYAAVDNLGCGGDRMPVVAYVERKPAMPIAPPVSRCGPGRVTITAIFGTPAGSQINLYETPVGGTPIVTDFNNPFELIIPYDITSSVTYYLSSAVVGEDCESDRFPIKINIQPLPVKPVVESVSRCGPGSVTFSVWIPDALQGMVRLYNSPSGAQPIDMQPNPPYRFLSPPVTTNTTFYFEHIDPLTLCASERASAELRIIPVPGPPTAVSEPRCGAGPVTISVAQGQPTGTQFVLYNNELNEIKKVDASLSTITTDNISSSTNYFIRVVNTLTGCSSAIVLVPLTINPLPLSPVASDVIRCGAGGATFSVDLPDGSIVRLYDSNDNTRELIASDNNAPYLLTIPFWATSHTFYLERELGSTGCRSALQPVRLLINSIPAKPNVANVARCGSGSVTFSVQMGSPPGNQVFLYAASSGGQSITSATTAPYLLTSPNIQNTTTFYFSSFHSQTGCESERTAAIAIINPLPPAPVVNNNVILCGIGQANFSAFVEHSSVNRVVLYSEPNLLSPVNETSIKPFILKTPLIENSRTYWIAAMSDQGCPSEFVPASVLVYAPPAPPVFQTVERCGPGLVTLTFRMGSPAGNRILLFSQETDESPFITLSHSPYLAPLVVNETKVIYAQVLNSNLGCASIKLPVTIKVNPVPERPEIQSNAPICNGETLKLSILSPNSNHTYLWRGPDGWQQIGATVYRSISAIELGGTYSVVAIAGSCTSEAASENIIIRRGIPTPVAGAYHIYNDPTAHCEGNELNLEVKNYDQFPAGTEFVWRGPNQTTVATHPHPAFPNASPSLSGTYAVYAVYQGCTSKVDTIRVRIYPKPAPPTYTGNTIFCEGSSNFSLSILPLPPSAMEYYSYQWHGPNGFYQTGTTVSRPSILPNAGTYTVRTVSSYGCISEPTHITVEIIPRLPLPTIVGPSSICMGQRLKIDASSSLSNPIYYWRGPGGWQFVGGATVERENVVLSDGGTYSVSVVSRGCTSAPSTINVEVRRAPAKPPIFDNSPICAGDRLVLSTTPIEGAYYYWQGPCFEHSGADYRIFREAILSRCAGPHSLTVIQNGCSSEVAIKSISIYNKPIISVTNDGPKCLGNEVTLSVQGEDGQPLPPGTQFIWSGPNGFNVTSTSSTVNRLLQTSQDQGTYSVIAVVATNCSSVTQTTLVRTQPVPTLPTVVNDGPKCEGERLTFTVTGSPGATYLWRGPNGFNVTTTQTSISRTSVTVQDAGQYSLQMVVRGCTTVAQISSVVIRPRPPLPIANATSPVCEGNTITLSASGVQPVVTYRWAGPGAFVRTTTENNLTLPNAQPGSYAYTVTAIVAGCTSLPAVTTVEVLQVPLAPNITVDGGIRKCVNDILQLNASIEQEPATYIWSGPQGYSAVGNSVNKQLLSPQEAGYYEVFAIYQSCTTAKSRIYINVNDRPAPPSIRGNSPVCDGERIHLTAITGDNSYEFYWNGPGGFSSTSSEINRIANSLSAGAYSVVAIQGGCTSSVSVRNIQVNPAIPLPEVRSNSPICTGQTLEFTVLGSPLNNARYEWSGPNNRFSTQFKAVFTNVTTNDAGTYTLIIRQNGCASIPITLPVEIRSTPSAPVATNTGPVCEGQSLNLEASAVPGATYLWRGPQGFSATTQSVTLSNVLTNQSGTYSVQAIVQGCTSGVSTTLVSIQPKPATPLVSSNRIICSGNTLELTAVAQSLVSGYQWEGPNGFYASSQNVRIVNITTLATGTYVVRTQRGNCFSDPARIQVTVLPTPEPVLVGNNGPLCQGQELQLTASLFVGASYHWSGPANFTSTEQNPIVGNPSTGTYSVRVVLGQCTSRTVETRVTIFESPAVQVSNNSPICAGDKLEIHATHNPEWVYQWRGPNGFLHNQNSIVIENATLRNAGVYTLEVANSNCRSEQLLIQVAILSPPLVPSVSQNGPLCNGQVLQLFATSTPGAGYLWRGPGGFISTLQNPIVQNPIPGIYSVVSIMNGCTSLQATETVVINNANCCPAPASPFVEVINPTTAKINWANTLEGPICYIVSYGPKNQDPSSWLYSNLVPYPQTSLVIDNLDPTIEYGVQIRSNCTACAARSGNRSATVETSFRTINAKSYGNFEEKIWETQVYPNPNSGLFTVHLRSNFSGTITLSLRDLGARLVWQKSFNFEEGNSILPVDLMYISPGIYTFEFRNEESSKVVKLVISR
ncbi:MAG: T9SS type A sorting domain-containing protein [Bacteroidia bacterium]|nr:T9SS type A sorting domain-containing protein [Bacteroidia bacterium]